MRVAKTNCFLRQQRLRFSSIPSGQGTNRESCGDRESAGINRLGIGNERVLQGRFSQSLWPRTVRCRWQHRGCSIGKRKCRPTIELRNPHFRVPILSCQGEGHIVSTAMGKVDDERGGVSEPVHAWTFQAREPGDPISFRIAGWHIAAVRNGQRTSPRALLT